MTPVWALADRRGPASLPTPPDLSRNGAGCPALSRQYTSRESHFRSPALRALILSAALSLLTTPVVAQSLSLEGPAGAKVELSAADVGALPRVKFVFDAHGDKPAAQPHKH